MVTKPSMMKERKAKTLSEWGAREGSRRRGFSVSHEQFHSYLDTGLLSPSDEHGRWFPDVVDRLIAIRTLSETVRSLPRRVIYLYSPGITFTTEDALWHAIQDATPIVEQDDECRDATMRRVFDALLPMTTARERLPPDWQPPPAKTWRGLIHLYRLPIARRRIEQWYRWAHRLAEPLADIPFDERVVLVALCDLAMQSAFAMGYALAHEPWVTDEKVPINPALAAIPEVQTAGCDEGQTGDAAPHMVIRTRADGVFSGAVVQPEQAGTAAEGGNEAGADTRERRAAG